MLIDAHAHVDRFGERLAPALAEIRAKRILTLAVSMDVASYEETVRVCRSDPLLIPGFGIHPWEAPAWHDRLDELEPLVREAPMLGEVGLDRHFVKDAEAYRPQERVFDYFLSAAESTGKLLNLHTTGAERRVVERLRGRALPAVIVHWYSGPDRELDALIDGGVWFTVGVEVLRSARIEAIARRIPDDRLLTETDNPGGWEWMTGEPGMPSLLDSVLDRLASVRRTSRRHLAELIGQNARTLLGDAGLGVPDPGPGG